MISSAESYAGGYGHIAVTFIAEESCNLISSRGAQDHATDLLTKNAVLTVCIATKKLHHLNGQRMSVVCV